MADVLKEAWIWLLLAFVIGVLVGYFLRKYTVRERVTTEVTSAASEADAALAAEREAHAANKAALEECRAGSEATAAAAGASATATKASSAKAAGSKAAAAKAGTAAKAATAASAVAAPKPTTKPTTKKAAPALDLAAGKAVLGVTVRMDDLKLIEGIGPKIDGLMRADGITTWAELSKANVERLRAILDAAGPRYNIHDPGSWPKQARLLAAGKWQEFKELTDSLKGGR